MASSSNGSMSVESRQTSCFTNWLRIQEQDLLELLQVQNNGSDEVLLRQVIQKNIQHFEEYAEQRAQLASEHVSPYFAPPWCTNLEASLLWIGGFRPSVYIRLLYALMGIQIEAFVKELLEGTREATVLNLDMHLRLLNYITGRQLNMIGALHCKRIDDEDRLSDEMISLEKEMNLNSRVRGGEVAAGEALNLHDNKSMKIILQQADNLRIDTLKKLLDILNPTQGVDFLICSKKIDIYLRSLGEILDNKHG